MIHRSIPAIPAMRLLAGCCLLLGTDVVTGQPAPTNRSAAVTPSTTLDSGLGSNAAAASSTRADAAALAAGTQRAEALDTWGTSDAEDASTRAAASTRPPAPIDFPTSPDPCRGKPAANDEDSGHVRYQLEHIEVRGNERTRSSVILRYLPFRVGKELDANDVEFTLARYRLLGTGFFREVEFSLRKGSRRGNVVLVVDVVERNTVVVNGVWMGLSKDATPNGDKRTLTAYAGFDFAETNLAGTGITLGGALGLAQDQIALRVRFLEPAFLGSPWMITGTLLHNRATDFFGMQNVLWGPYSDGGVRPAYAVLPYKRFGGSVGVGRDLSISTQLWFHYRLETINAKRPAFAVQNRGGKTENIEFDILQGRSVFSAVRANFQYDTRDHPFLPTRGWLFTTWGELGLLPLGSDYDYQRFDVSASYWWHRANSSHVWRLQWFAGAMTGNVPFFEQYYVGDFCDFLPARMLSLNVDRRPSPDYLHLDTAIQEVRYGHYAAQIAGEYRFPIFRGHRSVYGIDLFLRAGVFAVAHRRDLVDPAPRYRGFRRIPFDLTANAGFRMDTSLGGVVVSVSNVLGLLPGDQ